jgi:dipeptidyl aminopeptidase/acylaminoacyl peptidase
MPFEFARFLHIRSSHSPAFSPDGERLAFISDLTGVPQAWTIGRGGGWPSRITFTDERVSLAAYARHSPRLIIAEDTGGNEHHQLYVVDEQGMQPRPVAVDPAVIHHFGDWAPDDSSIAFSSNRRRGEFFDVYVAPLDGGPARCVLQQDGANHAGQFLPDGHHLLVRRVHGSFDIEAFLLDLRDGSLQRLSAGPGESCYHPLVPAPDGETVYALTDWGRDFVGLGAFRASDASWRWLVVEDRDLERFALSRDGRLAALVWNHGGYGQLEICSTADWRKRWVPTLPAGVIAPYVSSGPVWSPDSRWLASAVDSPRHNLDVWLLDVERERAGKLTQGSRGGLPLETLPVPELIHFPTFDKRSIPAFLYRPAGGGGPLPVVVLVHGGPESQSRPNFQAVVAYLVNLGLGVLLPNVRGSTGYGKAYTALDDVEKRMDSVRDLQHAALWLASSGIAPRDRIAVMGGSYGGFMVLAAITNFPELWAAAVDIVGIANFVTFLEHTGPWRRRQREQEYGSLEHDLELLRDISPIHKADRIRAPLMVIHGVNDPRVPLYEAEQIVAAVRARGGVVELLTYQDEGHGLVRLKNRLDAYPRIGAFLERHLKIADPVPADSLRR